VEQKHLGTRKLSDMRYAGTKSLSETMVWNRAPRDLKTCSKTDNSKPVQPDVTEDPVKTSQNAKKQTEAAHNKREKENADVRARVETAVAGYIALRREAEAESNGTSPQVTVAAGKPDSKGKALQEAEAKRRAKEAEAKQLAEKAEAERKAARKAEAKRRAAEAKAKRRAKEAKTKRLAEKAEAKRKAARKAEAKRRAEEAVEEPLPPRVTKTAAISEVEADGTSRQMKRAAAKPKTKQKRRRRRKASRPARAKPTRRRAGKKSCRYVVPYINRVVNVPCSG
jgi:colicin import membrane protein